MTRDDLIEKAAKAIWIERNAGADIGWGEMAWSELTSPDDWNQEALDALEEARAALAVFEESLTPTGDGRVVTHPVGVNAVPAAGIRVSEPFVAPVAGVYEVSATGLRLIRAEVPEPSAEYAKVWDAAFFKGWLDRHVARPDADGNFGPTLPLPNPYGKVQHSMACDACGALTFDSARFGTAHEAKADGRGCSGMFTTPRKDAKPQGEPSSEVPEPSAENMRQMRYDDGSWSRTLEGPIRSRDEQDAETMNAMAHHLRRIADPEPQGEPSHLSDDEEVRADVFDEHMSSNARMIRDVMQGEPSDAEVQAFVSAINGEGFVLDRLAVRVGLRAAAAVRGTGGEQ